MALLTGQKMSLSANEFTGFFQVIDNLNAQFKGGSNVQKIKYYPF